MRGGGGLGWGVGGRGVGAAGHNFMYSDKSVGTGCKEAKEIGKGRKVRKEGKSLFTIDVYIWLSFVVAVVEAFFFLLLFFNFKLEYECTRLRLI